MAIDEATARERLLAERRRLEALRDGQPSQHLDESEQESTGELSSFDQHPADMGTETFERERDQSLIERIDASLKDVDDALRRLDEGRYGICEGTGERIPDERLEALPAARYTVEYERQLERERNAGQPGGRTAAPGAAVPTGSPAGEPSPEEAPATAAAGRQKAGGEVNDPSAEPGNPGEESPDRVAGAEPAEASGDRGGGTEPAEASADAGERPQSFENATFATFNVTAAFPDMETARDAIESLERSGVAGSRISLLGKQAAEAADVRDTAQRDEATIKQGMRATIGGAAAGSGIGAAAGFLAGAVVFGVPGVGPAVGAGIWALTLGGAAAGGGVGFTAGAMANMKQSQAWELTFQEVSNGLVVVGAHTHDRDEYQSAVETLRNAGPERFHQFDNAGNELNAGGDEVAEGAEDEATER